MPNAAQNGRGQPRISLRTRLTLWVVAIFLLIQFVSALVFYLYQRSSYSEVFNQRLIERASTIAVELEPRLPLLTESELRLIADREARFIQFETFRIDVIDQNGMSAVRDAPLWPRAVVSYALPALRTGGTYIGALEDSDSILEATEGKHSRVVAMPITGPLGRTYALMVATSDAYLVQQIGLVVRILALVGTIGAFASAISGWFIAGIAVEPFYRIAAAASELGPESINRELDIHSSNAEVAELSEELEAARLRIRDAFAAQERFLSNISHEIKTPIATVLLECQTLDRDGLTDDARDFVDTTTDEMRKLGRLVESFLTLTRVRDGSGPVRLTRYSANELVMDSVEDCLTLARHHRVRLEPRLLEDEAYLDAAIRGDADLLRTLVDNLVRNAIRFTPEYGTVNIVATAQNGELSIAVRDEGPGIPPELIDRIFDRFAQSAEELRRGRGHGLGLAIAQGIAELHGGRVDVRNLPDRGAEFTATLPLVHEDDHTPAPLDGGAA